jgi:hypothetical protein
LKTPTLPPEVASIGSQDQSEISIYQKLPDHELSSKEETKVIQQVHHRPYALHTLKQKGGARAINFDDDDYDDEEEPTIPNSTMEKSEETMLTTNEEDGTKKLKERIVYYYK